MEKLDVFVFLHDGRKYIKKIIDEFNNQIIDAKKELFFVVTDTGDGSIEELKELNQNVISIKENEFSNSLTREKVLFNSSADIAILLTQDCRLVNNDAYEKLSKCIDEEVKFAYLRQKNSNFTIERYTRKINYPKKSKIKDKSLIEKEGLNTFFASDACAAYDVSFFKEINGYDNKNLPTNEDMYYARKVILADKKVKYCADTFCDHTHKFKLKEIKARYYLVGKFFKENPEFKEYKSNKAGLKLDIIVFGLILITFNIAQLFMFIPNMLSRYSGTKEGEK
jgi:rhamnosyltransferase